MGIYNGQAGPVVFENAEDDDGNPAGGFVRGKGFEIQWQDGPLGPGVAIDAKTGEVLHEGSRDAPNGAFIEDILVACLQRIRYLNEAADGRFECSENKAAIRAIERAWANLQTRTLDRDIRGVEGTHQA